MSKVDFELRFEYPVPVSRLYDQFATAEGIRHWWTENCEMNERVGGKATFPFPDVGFRAAAIIERLESATCVEWRVIECQHPANTGWADLNDWEGTTIRFEVRSLGKHRSELRLTHSGLVPLECSDSCSSLWRFYLNESLRKYFESGTGQPYQDGQSRTY